MRSPIVHWLFACLLAAPAAAETIEVFDNHGGRVADYDARWAALAARGVSVSIVGGDTVPGCEASGWCGIVAPRSTPTEDH